MKRTQIQTFTAEWGECDNAGILFYPNYFRWFDRAAWAYFAAIDLPIPQAMQQYNTVGIPLVDVNAKFRAPCRYCEPLTIETRLTSWRERTFELQHRVINQGVVAVEGTETRFWGINDPVNVGKLVALPLPEAFIKRFVELED
ncbi:MAG: acyl-CoA thioesterase [Gammaproteobacteria bacterium]|nr:acyl-CoA thioesterase [Gammaproteobacteria bacterium]